MAHRKPMLLIQVSEIDTLSKSKSPHHGPAANHPPNQNHQWHLGPGPCPESQRPEDLHQIFLLQGPGVLAIQFGCKGE